MDVETQLSTTTVVNSVLTVHHSQSAVAILLSHSQTSSLHIGLPQ